MLELQISVSRTIVIKVNIISYGYESPQILLGADKNVGLKIVAFTSLYKQPTQNYNKGIAKSVADVFKLE